MLQIDHNNWWHAKAAELQGYADQGESLLCRDQGNFRSHLLNYLKASDDQKHTTEVEIIRHLLNAYSRTTDKKLEKHFAATC